MRSCHSAAGGVAGTLALGLTGTLFLAESYAVPMPINLNWDTGPRYAMPWGAVHRLNDGPLAYRHLLAMPDDTVVMELPFGDSAWDLRYVYYAGLHGKRIVNGYSGYFPDGYRARAARLAAIWTDREAAWTAVTTSGRHARAGAHGRLPRAGGPGDGVVAAGSRCAAHHRLRRRRPALRPAAVIPRRAW
jgi:hypothetical protein